MDVPAEFSLMNTQQHDAFLLRFRKCKGWVKNSIISLKQGIGFLDEKITSRSTACSGRNLSSFIDALDTGGGFTELTKHAILTMMMNWKNRKIWDLYGIPFVNAEGSLSKINGKIKNVQIMACIKGV